MGWQEGTRSIKLIFRISQQISDSIKLISSYLPKFMREIRFDKIGFNVLADTHNVRYALTFKNWQLDKEKDEM